MDKVIGLIGGMSWESTAEYYRLFNQLLEKKENLWHQPRLIIDSLDFGKLVPLTQQQRWDEVEVELLASAQRLIVAGAEVLILGANTAHISFDSLSQRLPVPMVDVRQAIADQVKGMGARSLALLGTKYVMGENFYRDKLSELGITVITPHDSDQDFLQHLIYQELSQGVFSNSSRAKFIEIAQRCIDQGAEVVGLCCTEFSLLIGDAPVPFRFIDSTRVHVETVLAL